MESSIRTIVIYDTLYGNTEKIAKALAKGLHLHLGEVDCVNINQIDPEKLAEYNLIAVGAPTQAFSASKPMKDWLHKLEGKNLAGRYGFAFDTKIDSRFSGSAGKYIESKLQELGLKMVEPRRSAIVRGGTRSSDLNPGEEDAFEKLGYDLGTVLVQKKASLGGGELGVQTSPQSQTQ